MTSFELDLAFKVHDLRNKIGAASSFAQLLTNQYPDLETNTYVVSIQECLDGAIEATRDISLGMRSPSEQGVLPSTKSMDVVSATQVLTVMAPQSFEALSRQFSIEIDYSCVVLPQDRGIVFNPAEISSIRENVVTNAIAAGATLLKVHYQMRPYGLVITMEDNGCGMNEDQLCQLQLKQAGDGFVHGIGTNKIMTAIDEHRSVVTYSSREGEGTTVKILCPYADESAGAPTGDLPSP